MNPVLIASLFTIPAVQPQEAESHGQTSAVTTSEQVVPERRGETGTLRYAEHADEDVTLYRPIEIVDTGVDPVHQGPVEAITFEVATGLEEIHLLPADPFRTQGWIAGRKLAEEVNESLDASFGCPTRITSAAYPWSAQSRVFFRQDVDNDGVYESSESFVCSGTMIDAKNLITAGHCVHEGAGGTWSGNVWVAPRWDGDSNAFGTANATLLGSFTGWTNSSSSGHDMGFIRVDRPVGFLTGWLGSFWNSDNAFWYGTTFNMAGYPATVSSAFPNAPHSLYYMWGGWDIVGSTTVDHNNTCTTADFGGLSGTGMYYIDSAGNRYVGGDHRSSYWSGSTRYRRTCRMTQGKFDWFHNTFKPGGYFKTLVDYVPLRVRLSKSTIKKGTSASMSYVVANNSMFNPASANVDVDVYLSTNTDISTFDTLIQSHYFTWNFAPKSSVTINVGSVTIPGTTTAGTKYLGIIVDETDAATSNNDSDGWDAHRITVTN